LTPGWVEVASSCASTTFPIAKERFVADGTTPATDLDDATERALGVALYNRTWELLEVPHRTPSQVDEMIHTAHASRYHWTRVAEPANLARGEWLCSRVYAVLGRGEPALWHARRCVEIDEAAGIGDWDTAAAYEAMARASAVAGDRAAARAWVARGREACAAIADADDREHIEADLATVPLD
jgi:hypothetical protein